jgi:hypothetical protein
VDSLARPKRAWFRFESASLKRPPARLRPLPRDLARRLRALRRPDARASLARCLEGGAPTCCGQAGCPTAEGPWGNGPPRLRPHRPEPRGAGSVTSGLYPPPRLRGVFPKYGQHWGLRPSQLSFRVGGARGLRFPQPHCNLRPSSWTPLSLFETTEDASGIRAVRYTKLACV